MWYNPPSVYNAHVWMSSLFFSLFMYSGFFGVFFDFPDYLSYIYLVAFFILSLFFIKTLHIYLVFIGVGVLLLFVFFSFFSFYADNEYLKSGKLLLILFFSSYSAAFFCSKMYSIKQLAFILSMLSMIISLLALSKGGVGSDVRLMQGDGNPIWIARCSGISALYFFIKMKKGNKTVLELLLFMLSLLVIFLSGSRGPLASMILAIIIWLMLFDVRSVSKLMSAIFLLSITIVCSYFLLPDLMVERVFGFISGNFSSSDEYRLYLYKLAWSIFTGNPMGIGLGGFSEYALLPYPHNLVLEILSELGFLVMALFSLILFFVFFKSAKIIKRYYQNNIEVNFFYCLLIFSFTNAMFSGDLTSPKEFYFTLFFFIYFIYLSGSKNNETSTTRYG